MKKIRTLLTTGFIVLSMSFTSFAGTWQAQENGQWKYQNDDGSYATGWLDDNEKSYYMDENGIMLTSTLTPDDYYVGKDGYCTRNPESSTAENTYQGILDSYAAKLKSATPILLEEYRIEASSNTNGLNGLAELHNKKLEILAQIEGNGISKMAELWLNYGSGSYDEYLNWGNKLFDVYIAEGEILFDAYIESAS